MCNSKETWLVYVSISHFTDLLQHKTFQLKFILWQVIFKSNFSFSTVFGKRWIYQRTRTCRTPSSAQQDQRCIALKALKWTTVPWYQSQWYQINKSRLCTKDLKKNEFKRWVFINYILKGQNIYFLNAYM